MPYIRMSRYSKDALEALKPYIVSRAGGVDRRAKLTEKNNFVKGVFNRKHEKARHEIQNINSIIDAPPPARIYIYIYI